MSPRIRFAATLTIALPLFTITAKAQCPPDATPPTISVPADATVECSDPGNGGSLAPNTPGCAATRSIPQDGLLLHLDGRNPGNSAAVWADSSLTFNDAAMTGTTQLADGYSFPSGTGDVGVFTQIQPQAADRFAFGVRFTAGTPGGVQDLLSSSGAGWNHLYLDYANNAVAWGIYNASVAMGADYFRSGVGKIQASTLSGEHLVMVTWESTSGAGGNYGTARLYLDGVFRMQVLSALKPAPSAFPVHDAFSQLGRRGGSTSEFNGSIAQVAVYSGFSGSADALAADVYDSNVGVLDPTASGIATATDNCDAPGAITITKCDAATAGSCPQEIVITRTWAATDTSGNTSNGVQTVTVTDTTAPVVTPPPDTTIACAAPATIAESVPTTPGCALNERRIPTAGLVLHLDGANPDNDGSTWFDSSPSGNDATINGATQAADGYDFDGIADDALLASGVTVHQGDKFAIFVRATSTTSSGQPRVLGPNTSGDWHSLIYDYSNNKFDWHVYNSTLTMGAEHFRTGAGITLSTLSGNNCIGVTWEADSAGSNYGTATLYLDGVFVMQITSAIKPDPNHATLSVLRRIGSRGGIGSFWQGNIAHVAIYNDFADPDDLAFEVAEAVSGIPTTDQTGVATAADNCAETASLTTTKCDVVDASDPKQTVVTRTWSVTDECGNTGTAEQIITIVTTTCADFAVAMQAAVCADFGANTPTSQAEADQRIADLVNGAVGSAVICDQDPGDCAQSVIDGL